MGCPNRPALLAGHEIAYYASLQLVTTTRGVAALYCRKGIIPMTLATTRTRFCPRQNLQTLRQAGNPFRNYFARNPDDEVCRGFHVRDWCARAQPIAGRRRSLSRHAGHPFGNGADPRQQGGRQNAFASLHQAWQRRGLAAFGHAGNLSARRRFHGVFAVSNHRHSPGRRQAKGTPPLGIHQRAIDARAVAPRLMFGEQG